MHHHRCRWRTLRPLPGARPVHLRRIAHGARRLLHPLHDGGLLDRICWDNPRSMRAVPQHSVRPRLGRRELGRRRQEGSRYCDRDWVWEFRAVRPSFSSGLSWEHGAESRV